MALNYNLSYFHPFAISQKLCLGMEDVLWVNQEASCFVRKPTKQLHAQQSEPYLVPENELSTNCETGGKCTEHRWDQLIAQNSFTRQ